MKKSASSRSGARAQKKSTSTTAASITAADLDAKFDAGEDISAYLELDKAIRPGRSVQRVNVDFPTDLLRAIDREATRIGVARQAWIKLRLADCVEARPSLDAVGTSGGKATVSR